MDATAQCTSFSFNTETIAAASVDLPGQRRKSILLTTPLRALHRDQEWPPVQLAEDEPGDKLCLCSNLRQHGG